MRAERETMPSFSLPSPAVSYFSNLIILLSFKKPIYRLTLIGIYEVIPSQLLARKELNLAIMKQLL